MVKQGRTATTCTNNGGRGWTRSNGAGRGSARRTRPGTSVNMHKHGPAGLDGSHRRVKWTNTVDVDKHGQRGWVQVSVGKRRRRTRLTWINTV